VRPVAEVALERRVDLCVARLEEPEALVGLEALDRDVVLEGPPEDPLHLLAPAGGVERDRAGGLLALDVADLSGFS
jgi:hypothetical protein